MTYKPMSDEQAAQEATFWDATNKDSSLIPTGWACSYCEGRGWTFQFVLSGFDGADVQEEWEPCRCNPHLIPIEEFQKR